MADKSNITIHMQGMRAANALSSVIMQQKGLQPQPTTGASFAEQGQAISLSLSKQYPELQAMLTSKEALMASVSMQVALQGFEPIANVFERDSW